MNNNTIVKQVADYIETHIDEDLSLDKIAKELNYSKFYLARIFNKETKCTIYKYIQGRRLTLAAQKLIETKKSILEIAYEAHYSSHQAFTYAFNNLYQCTPQTYRKNGVFYPKQLRIDMTTSLNAYSNLYCIWGGKMSA